MDDKKLSNSKVIIFFDWVWRLMVLNVLTILCSVGIITIVPALCATFKTIKDTKENYSPQIIRKYFYNFRYLFRDTFLFSIILILIVGISGYAFLWYDGVVGTTQGSDISMDQTWLTISMIAITVVVIGILVITISFIQIPMVINYFYCRFTDNIKLCFYMAYKYIITSLIELVIVGVSIVVLINGLFTYYLLPMWLFFGISLPQYAIYTISRKFYLYVSGEIEDDDEEIDYQNKTVNREIYEDETKTLKGEQND